MTLAEKVYLEYAKRVKTDPNVDVKLIASSLDKCIIVGEYNDFLNINFSDGSNIVGIMSGTPKLFVKEILDGQLKRL